MNEQHSYKARLFALLLLSAFIAIVYFFTFLISNQKYTLSASNTYIAPIEKVEATTQKHALVPITEKDNSDQVNINATSDTYTSKYMYMLSIPKIDVYAGVQAMGIEPDGKMAVPNNYTEVGWYKYGTVPGERGSAVMGAHVDDGSTTSGVFKNLHTLKMGDSVYVIRQSDQKELHFKVILTKIYDRNEKNTKDVWRSAEGSHLNLITCFGKWLAGENTYEKRIVVFTELVSEE